MGKKDQAVEPLAPETTARVTEFARACRSAARAVSLYPGGHPAIQASLQRLVDAAARVTTQGALNLKVLPDLLLVGEQAPARPDPVIGELAALLHHQRIAALVLHGGTDAESWRILLQLVARPAEEVRADGGIAYLWTTAGGPSIEIEEIDYARLLRDRLGDAAALDAVLSWCVSDADEAGFNLDQQTLDALAGLVGDVEVLAELAAALERRAGEGGVVAQAAAILRLMKALTEHLARSRPAELQTAWQQLGRMVGQLSPALVTELIARPDPPLAATGGVGLVGAVARQVRERDAAHVVAESVITEHGATERLAEAFQSLAPDVDRKRRLLSLAEREVSASPLGQEESFPQLWQRVEQMLTTYSDRPFVSDAYARELDALKNRALDVEQASDDPPDRIVNWLSTVGDSALRSLDHQLLHDLLTIEIDPERWRELAETVVQHAQDLARVGQLAAVAEILAPLTREAGEGGRAALQPVARETLEQLASGPLVRLMSASLRTADDAGFDAIGRLCHAIGPIAVRGLAEALAVEQDAKARRRLREILVGFGARGRASVEQLMSAPNWEVRRTAAYLLREFGGAESLQSLEPLLNDSDPRVQREALRALLLVGDDRASEMLLRALERGTTQTRETVVTELSSLRDERAGALCCYLIRRVSARRFSDVYLAAIEALGSSAGRDVIDTLRDALYRGEWWAPFRTRALRSAAAAALRRMGDTAALEVLQTASARASRGVRAVARAQLAHKGDSR